jgi:hypothetical protein
LRNQPQGGANRIGMRSAGVPVSVIAGSLEVDVTLDSTDIESIMATASRGYWPLADSADNITASLPS